MSISTLLVASIVYIELACACALALSDAQTFSQLRYEWRRDKVAAGTLVTFGIILSPFFLAYLIFTFTDDEGF